jgi:hypothetical protein
MERRDWSLDALNEFIYIDSLDDEQKAIGLEKWVKKYLDQNDISDIDLPKDKLIQLEELFFKNINFLKRFRENQRLELIKLNDLKKFLDH